MFNKADIKPYPIPVWELNQKKIGGLKESIFTKLVQGAIDRCVISRSVEAEIRPILAEDLSLESWVTPSLKRGQTIDWIDTGCLSARFMAFYGIIVITEKPAISVISFNRMFIKSYHEIAKMEIDKLYSVLPIINRMSNLDYSKSIIYQYGSLENIRMQAYMTPIYYSYGERIRISIKAIRDTDGEHLILGGYLLEPQVSIVI